MGKLDFISILCLSLALLANPLIGMQYCTVHHHFLEKLSETHVHAEHCGSWHSCVHESHHEITPSRVRGAEIPAEICGCTVHGHSDACESMIPAEFFVTEPLSVFFWVSSGEFFSFTLDLFSQDSFQGSESKFRLGQNWFLTFSSGKVRTHLLKSVLVI